MGIPIEKVNFPQPGCNLINEEVNRATHGMIDQIISPTDLDPLTRIVLLNAIYFKCGWKEEFEEMEGRIRYIEFILANGSKIHVTMLASTEQEFDYVENI